MASVDSLSIQITASTASAKERVDALVKSLDSLVSAIDRIDSSKITSLASSVSSLGEGLSLLKGSSIKNISKIAETCDEISTKGKEAFEPMIQDAETLAEETSAISESVEKVNTEVGNLNAEPLENMSASAEKVSASFEKTTSKMGHFKLLLSNLKIIVPTEGLDKVNKKIDKLKDKIADLKDQLEYKSSHQTDYVDSEEMEKDQKQIQALINELDRLQLKQKELQTHGGFKFNGGGIFSGIGKAVNTFHGQVSTLKKGLDGLISKFHHTSKASRATAKATDGFKFSSDRLVKSLTKVTRMLRLMILRMALRTVIKEVGNGFKSLALHCEEFDNAMSNLRNSAKTLGYSFSAMVAPLLQALAPAIIYIINLLMKLMNAINQVFAALSGKGTWNKAKDFTGKWSDDIKAANKSAKELKKTVLGFDELNQLQENKDSGGGASNNIEDMFETLEVEQKWKNVADYIKNLAKKLFQPIKNAWAKVGDFVKKSWKYAMEEVYKLGASVARDFWKVWNQEKTQKIFENILKIIGWIGQTVGNLARQFRKAWDENDTGLHILEKIRDIILIITDHFEDMAKATAEWAASLDFSPILTKFNEWLDSLKPVIDNIMGVFNDFYQDVILPLGKWAVEEGAPQLLQVFIDFNEKVKWNELRDKLKELWAHLEPFMETVGEGLIIFIDRCAQALANFINSETFERFLKKVEDFMDSVTPQDVADGLEAIAKAIAAFAIGKAVVDGLLAVSSFLKLVSSLAPTLKLAVVISAAYAGYKLGGLLGKWLTDDDEIYDEYTLPVVIEWIVDEFPESWVDFNDKVQDWADAWLHMREEAGLFVQLLTRLVEGPYLSAILDVISFFKGDKTGGMSFSGGSGANVEADEWQKTVEAAKEATESTKEFKKVSEETSTAVKGYWKDLPNGQKVFIETNKKAAESVTEVSTATKGIEGSTKSFQVLAGAAKDLSNQVSSIKTPLDNVKVSSENVKNVNDLTKGSFDNMLTSMKDVAAQTPVLTQEQKDLEASFKNTANVTPTFTASQQKIVESLKGVETQTTELTKTNSVSWTTVTSDVANAQVSFSGTMKEMTKDVDSSMNEITKSTDKVKDAFSEDKWTFSGVWEGLTKTFQKAKEGIKSTWNSIADKLNGDYEIGNGKFKINLPKFYATGGFPEDGWFRASHGEMIGKFDNGQSVVANNAQIVEGISAGVYNAVSSAMARSGASGSGSEYISNTIILDGEVIARSITKAQEKQNRRYSPQTV